MDGGNSQWTGNEIGWKRLWLQAAQACCLDLVQWLAGGLLEVGGQRRYLPRSRLGRLQREQRQNRRHKYLYMSDGWLPVSRAPGHPLDRISFITSFGSS
jgi:hypothetical protein